MASLDLTYGETILYGAVKRQGPHHQFHHVAPGLPRYLRTLVLPQH